MASSINSRRARGGEINSGGMTTGELNQRNLAERRHKKGECIRCGNKTHKIGLFGKRTALTTEGLCLFGRCLLCEPAEGIARIPMDVTNPQVHPISPSPELHTHNQYLQNLPMTMIPSGLPNIPHDLVIEAPNREGNTADDGSIVSGITMDPRLIHGHRDLHGDDGYDDESTIGNDWLVNRKGRPEPSVSGMDEISRPPLRPGLESPISSYRPTFNRGREDAWNSASRPPFHNTTEESFEAPHFATSLGVNRSSLLGTPIDELRGGPISRTSNLRGESRNDTHKDMYKFHDDYGTRNPYLSALNQNSIDVSIGEVVQPINNKMHSNERTTNSRIDEMDDEVLKQAETYGDSLYDREPKVAHEIGSAVNYNRRESESSIIQDLDRTRVPQPMASRFGGSVWSNSNSGLPNLQNQNRRGQPDDDHTVGLDRSGKPKVGNVKRPVEANQNSLKNSSNSGDEIKTIISNLDDRNQENTFKSLAVLILRDGQEAKIGFTTHVGIQLLVDSIYTHMHDSRVMESICELLFALVASSDGKSESDVLVGNSAEGAVDALLFTMQTHSNVESIQWAGCGTLNCLATASSSNVLVPDGSESGSVFIVTQAMSNHRESQPVQECGIRAIYSLCMLSKHAEYNKKKLIDNGKDNGGVGMGVITFAMETAKTDLVTLELSCRLYWNLAANEDVAQELMETPRAFTAIMNAIDRNHKKPEALPMMEAAFGALANLARVNDVHSLFHNSDIIVKATQSIKSFHYDEVLYVEACALLGVLATDSRNKQNLLTCDAVSLISKLIQKYANDQTLQEEALWALICISHDCDTAKLSLSSETNSIIGFLVRMMREKGSSSTLKLMACTLTGSLCTLKESVNLVVTNGAIDAVLQLLKDFPEDKKIQEASFMALRNITTEGIVVDQFLRFETTKTILEAMSFSEESISAQSNVCCLLWNICAKATRDPSVLVDAGAIMKIVRAMQLHLESGDVVEMACGALWRLIHQSESRKKEILACGAIDAVTCTIAMHPEEPATLEKACGLLANVCTTMHMAEAIAGSHGISIVIDAMTANSSALKFLELGTLVLRNIVLTKKDLAAEALNGIPIILTCMKENPNAVDFQREACFALWALAAQSFECKKRIESLDGVSILRAAHDQNSDFGDILDATQGAMNELSLSISNT
jgi:hypothetical protein